MTAELEIVLEPPTTDAEVVQRLKNQPKKIRIDASCDMNPPQYRAFTKLVYDFTGKLKKLGTFLFDIAKDVEQAGGYVTGFNFSNASNLEPVDRALGNHDPSGKWRAMFVEVHIRPKVVVDAQNKGWHDAMKDYFAESRRKA